MLFRSIDSKTTILTNLQNSLDARASRYKFFSSSNYQEREGTDTQFKVSKQNSILDLIDTYRILQGNNLVENVSTLPTRMRQLHSWYLRSAKDGTVFGSREDFDAP